MSEVNEPNPNRAPWASPSSGGDGFGPAESPAPYRSSQLGSQPTEGKKRGLGCWLWGCLGLTVFMLIAIIGMGFATYFFWTAQVAKYTDTQPAELPVVEMEAEELQTLEKRIESFTNQVRPATESKTKTDTSETVADSADQVDQSGTSADSSAGQESLPDAAELEPPPRELVLTAKELNGLIAANPDLRGRVFVKINEGIVSGQVSFPTDMIPGASGRYFNADAEFDVSMQDGILVVRLTDARVKGERIPQTFLESLAQTNLAKDFDSDPENAEMLRKFDSIEVLGDSIVLRLKEPEVSAEADLDSETTASETTASETAAEATDQPEASEAIQPEQEAAQ